jgi:chromosome segregation ATPase
MDAEARFNAIEERLSEVEKAQRDQATALRTMFEFVQRIDANMTTLVARVQALETNFSLLNAAVVGIITRVDALDAKVTAIDSKLDQILTLLRSPDGARPH